ncbi:heavy-metal-associated domain-containing protein [Emticicia oligotrophica]|uniref:heavy-metal-associated domain-containing protein n=1 Tax=Emticicia oligotrophica TaxID=312279 RepID=UPI00273AA76B|nr:heavy-metal-associated domain-containing protein [Emticicia oligotrophica]
MKTEEIIIANLKCNGCASTIKKEIAALSGVKEVAVDVEKDAVKVTYENIGRESIINKLYSLGYPEATEKNGLLLQIKSYGSCMVGRINNL